MALELIGIGVVVFVVAAAAAVVVIVFQTVNFTLENKNEADEIDILRQTNKQTDKQTKKLDHY